MNRSSSGYYSRGGRGGSNSGRQVSDNHRFSREGGNNSQWHGSNSEGRTYSGNYNKPARSNLPMPGSIKMPIVMRSPNRMAKRQTGDEVDTITNLSPIKILNESLHSYNIAINGIEYETDEGRKISFSEQKIKFWIKEEFQNFIVHCRNSFEILQNRLFLYDNNQNIYVKNEPLNIENGEEFAVNFQSQHGRQTVRFSLKSGKSIDLNKINEFFSNQGRVDITNQKLLLSVLLMNKISGMNIFEQFGSNYFDIENDFRETNISVYTFLRGIAVAFRPSECGPSINTHLRSAVMITRRFTTLQEFLRNRFGDSETWIRNLNRINREIGGFIIFANHSGQRIKYKVRRLCELKPNEKKPKGMEKTVEAYFAEKYRYVCQDYLLVECTKKNVFLPLELCYLDDKQFIKKKSIQEDLIDQRLAYAALTPNIYMNKVQKYVEAISTQGRLNEYGVEITPKLMSVTARVAKEPQRNLVSIFKSKFYQPKKIGKIVGIFFFDRSPDKKKFEDFLENFKTEAVNKGLMSNDVQITERRYYPTSISRQELKNLFTKAKQFKYDIVLSVLPKNTELYDMIKHICNVEVGIPVQCILEKNVINTPGGYHRNLMLKVNGKLGGTNDGVNLRNMVSKFQQTMVVGMDVVHITADTETPESIAGAVGSYDSNFCQFSSFFSVQTRDRREIILKVDGLMKSMLEEYRKQNGQYPKHVVLFRDGVSESQLEELKSKELQKIKNILKEKNIKLTCIVVQKRISERFALKKERITGKDRFGNDKTTFNVPQGTIIDHSITDCDRDEFLIVPHESPLGTAKPCKCIVMENQFNLTFTEIQDFCYAMCQTSTRTVKSVSVPVPIVYADFLAYRGKQFLKVFRTLFKEMTKEEFENRLQSFHNQMNVFNGQQILLHFT